MSKKGKGGKGKGGKDKSRKSKGETAGKPLKSTQMDEMTKQFFIWQIRILEDKVLRYQKQNDELVVASQHFQEKIDQCIADKNDIVVFWKNQLEAKTTAYNDLNDKFLTLKQILENEQELCRKQMAHIRREADDNQSLIVAENMTLNSKLASLEEFCIQKDNMIAKLESLEEELTNKNEEYNEIISSMEQKMVFDRERLKADMISRIKKVAAEFRRVTEKTLNTTIKRTLNENVMVSAQLAKMSDKTVELIEENDKQMAATAKLEQKTHMLESNETQLIKQLNKTLKLLHNMRQLCKDQQKIIEEQLRKNAKLDHHMTECEHYKSKLDLLSKEVKRLNDKCDQLTDENLKLQLQGLTDTDSKKEMHMLFNHSVEAIKESLTMMDPYNYETGIRDDASFSINYDELRKNMLESLVVLLKSSAALGIQPAKQDVDISSLSVTKSISYIPGSKHQWSNKQLPRDSFPYYMQGDLGLVPKRKNQIKSVKDRMKMVRNEAEFDNYRSILFKSLGSQTESSPLSLLYSQHVLNRDRLPLITSNKARKPLTTSVPLVKPKKIFKQF